ncbi:MAG: hypothetical protein ACE5JM_09205 [Armatimonadota bacterium]
MSKPTIAVVAIATGPYVSLAHALGDSVRQHFPPGTDFRMIGGHCRAWWPHLPWPLGTLLRYHALLAESRLWCTDDYAYLIDADMRVVAPIGEEILGQSVAVLHPGYHESPRHDLPYETQPDSTAAVASREGDSYYSGALVGGEAAEFHGRCQDIAGMIDEDMRNHVIARWHDESYLNRDLIDHPPTIVLPPTYCSPQSGHYPGSQPAKIVALDKPLSLSGRTRDPEARA